MFNYKEYSLDKYGTWVVPILVNWSSEYGNPAIKENLPEDPVKDNVNHYYYDGEIKTAVYDKNEEGFVWKTLDFPVVPITPTDFRT